MTENKIVASNGSISWHVFSPWQSLSKLSSQ